MTNSKKKEDFYASYEKYAEVLRNWIAGYGAGCLAIIVSNEQLFNQLIENNSTKCAAFFMLAAVGLQILLIFINKIIMWTVYYGQDIDNAFKNKCRYKIADKLSMSYWYDLLLDLTSLVFLGLGTWLLIKAFEG